MQVDVYVNRIPSNCLQKMYYYIYKEVSGGNKRVAKSPDITAFQGA
jgi:hypothetical protein